MVTLVPEKRQELTTEGGLDVRVSKKDRIRGDQENKGYGNTGKSVYQSGP